MTSIRLLKNCSKFEAPKKFQTVSFFEEIFQFDTLQR